MDSRVEILLVEDNPNDVELTLHAFKKSRLANPLHIARDGDKALEFIFRNDGAGGWTDPSHPRIILLDLKLPKVDGLEVLRQVKADPRTHSIPVVVLTSSREDRDMVESYNLGVNSYIVKPVDFDRFVEAVAAVGFYWCAVNQAVSPRLAVS